MRRSVAVGLGVLLLGIGLPAERASAGATVDLLFVERNGVPIAPTDRVSDARAGDELTLAIRMRNDMPLTVAVFSLHYDLEGGDYLDVVSAFQWRGLAISGGGADAFVPIGELSPTTETFVGSFQGWTTNLLLPRALPAAAGAFAGGYQMGTVIFRLNPGASAGSTEIISGVLHAGIDAFGDAGFRDVSHLVRFNTASVNFIPEPATACLLALGLAGLALAGERSRTRR